jgi:hypothetical protein
MIDFIGNALALANVSAKRSMGPLDAPIYTAVSILWLLPFIMFEIIVLPVIMKYNI